MKRLVTLMLALAIFSGSHAVFAQSGPIDGQVTKVDPSAQKITIKHGPIPKLDMDEGMTMVFAAPDASMLKAVKVGDKVKFEADRVNGQLTLLKIEKVK
jgi:Cu(I)/Ag(I) efflux system protein CusF